MNKKAIEKANINKKLQMKQILNLYHCVIELLSSLQTTDQFDTTTKITEQDITFSNFLGQFMSTVKQTCDNFIHEIDRQKSMLHELSTEGRITGAMEEEGLNSVDTPAKMERAANKIWENIEELEKYASTFYQVNCYLNLTTMKLIMTNVIPKTFFKHPDFDLMLTKNLRKYKTGAPSYTIYPRLFNNWTRVLMDKLCVDEKAAKRKIIKIKEKLKEVMADYSELEKINAFTNGEDDLNLKNVRKAEREISDFVSNFVNFGGANKENRSATGNY
jgi:hypothetical protein